MGQQRTVVEDAAYLEGWDNALRCIQKEVQQNISLRSQGKRVNAWEEWLLNLLRSFLEHSPLDEEILAKAQAARSITSTDAKEVPA